MGKGGNRHAERAGSVKVLEVSPEITRKRHGAAGRFGHLGGGGEAAQIVREASPNPAPGRPTPAPEVVSPPRGEKREPGSWIDAAQEKVRKTNAVWRPDVAQAEMVAAGLGAPEGSPRWVLFRGRRWDCRVGD